MRCLLFLVMSLAVVCNVPAQHHISYKFQYFKTLEGETIPVVPTINDNIYQEYFISDGQYKSSHIGGVTLMEFYTSATNERTTIDLMGSPTTIPATRDRSPITALKITPLDSTREIMGHTCKGISVQHEDFTIDYYYSDQIRVNPQSFAGHTYMDWNQVMEAMNGAIPLQYGITMENRKIVATAIEVQSFDSKKESFNPRITFKDYEKSTKTDYKNTILPLLLKKKSTVTPKSFEAKGQAVLNDFKLPITILYKYPAYFSLVMSLNNLNFRMGFTPEEKWEYNPMEANVKVEKLDKKDVKENEIIEAFNPMIKSDWAEYKPIGVKETIDAYFFLIERDSNYFYYNLSKANSFITYWGKASSSFVLEDYQRVTEIPFPMHIVEYTASTGKVEMEMYLESIELNKELSNSLFMVPDELKDKVVYSTPTISTTAAEYYSLAEKFSKEQQYDSAVANYKKAIRLKGGDKVYHNQLGLAYTNMNEYYKGIAEFTKAIEIDPLYATAIGNLGYCKMALGDYGHAIEEFTTAIQLDSVNKTHFGNRGMSYYSLKDFEKAERDFEKTVTIDPDYGVGYWNVAMSQYNQENYEKAIGNFEEAFKRGQESGNGYNYRGVSYYNLEQFESALLDFKKAINLDKTEVEFYSNLGNTYAQLGDSKRALESYLHAVEVDSTYATGHNNIGLVYYNEDSYDAAINAFTKAILANPSEAVYFDNRAHAKTGKMDYLGAIEDYSESINLYPKDSNIFYLRGMAKINLNDKFDACRDLKKAMEMGSDEAKEAVAEHCQ